MEQVSPTRTELLSRKAQIRLAQTGAKLLKGKREALVAEFIREVRSLASDRQSMLRDLSESLQALILSLAVDGSESVRAVALAKPKGIEVELVERNIWGLKIVDLESAYRPAEGGGQNRSPFASSARVDEAATNFEKAVESVVNVAPKLHKLGRLAEEIRATTRRVNALEQRLLPSLSAQVSYVRAILDQREREDIFRLKRIKRKLAGGSGT